MACFCKLSTLSAILLILFFAPIATLYAQQNTRLTFTSIDPDSLRIFTNNFVKMKHAGFPVGQSLNFKLFHPLGQVGWNAPSGSFGGILRQDQESASLQENHGSQRSNYLIALRKLFLEHIKNRQSNEASNPFQSRKKTVSVFSNEPNFMPIKPDTVLPELINRLPEQAQSLIREQLNKPTARAEFTSCNKAYQALTLTIPQTGLRPIYNFHAACGWNYQSHKTANIEAAHVCLIRHKAYTETCLGKPFGDIEATPYVGVLTVQNKNNARRKIVCTATLVAPHIALTARHCLENLRLTGDRMDFVLPAYPGNLSSSNRDIIAAYISPLYERVEHSVLIANPSLLSGVVANDVAFVEFKTPITDIQLIQNLPELASNSNAILVRLIGYQPLSTRLDVLASMIEFNLLIDDEDMLQAEIWGEGIKEQKAAFCIMVDGDGPLLVKHGCQSAESTSGAPILTRSNSPSDVIVAIHTGVPEIGSRIRTNGGVRLSLSDIAAFSRIIGNDLISSR